MPKTLARRLRRAAAAAVLVLALPGLAGVPAVAETEDDAQPTNITVSPSQGSAAQKIKLGIGKSVIVDLPRDAKEVFVANPNVANAVVRSTRKLFLIGVGDGGTSVFVFDTEGRQMATLEIAIGRDLSKLQKTIKSMFPKSVIEVTSTGGSVLLTGEVDSANEAQKIVDVAKAFTVSITSSSTGAGGASSAASQGVVINALSIRGRDQVMIKVTIAEVERSVLKQLGINLTGQNWKVGSTTTSFSDLGRSGVASGNFGQAIATVFPAVGAGGTAISTLQALEQNGVLRLLAEPNLTAVSGETAKFLAGGEVPILAAETFDQGTRGFLRSYVYRPIGVSLEFTPVVLSEGRISLRVSTEVTEIDTDNAVTLVALSIPGFKVRRTSTTVELPSGGTMATAGLMQQKTAQNVSGFPGAMNLPIVGALFRSRRYQRLETELMISVTPYIVKPVAPSQIVRPDENFVDASDAQGVLLNRLHKIYGVAGPEAAPRGYRGKVGFIND